MIARVWRGVVQLDYADEYADYIRDTGFTDNARYLVGESTVTHSQVVDQVKDPSGPGEER